ncbi:hypothetical protein BSZ39_09910 [Bowdeniella nasicola]|uniref:Sugar kinase of the NBD/HSP70 family, may contain an N-terminal HTH domain n=1 Tax=Bowdeniella nasicola TaxID=208480 RepID=A0A1Q5Q0Z1_9ACTO|nr:ROK family protein [Bowdeniella nasicola]OKL53362.1 hypothetical protein BSZ39_09910 [Bowdeniella nasicola]
MSLVDTGPPVNQDLTDQALELITRGLVTSRTDLRHELQISASTASNIVRALIARGDVVEDGMTASTGGRPAVALRSTKRPELIALAEVGTSHVRLGFSSNHGDIGHTSEIPLDLSGPPSDALKTIVKAWHRVATSEFPDHPGIDQCALALPGPVRLSDQRVINPSRMPGWHGVDVVSLLSDIAEVPAVVDNDARAGARGEAARREGEFSQFIYVKAGSGIGASLAIDGEPFSGAFGMAGDLAHTPVGPKQEVYCACGKVGCLEILASGAAIRRTLSDQGEQVTSMLDIIQGAQQGNPIFTSAIRQAGTLVGLALAPLVNFLNPAAVILGGSLSSISSFKASARAALYDQCLPMSSENLAIVTSLTGPDAALHGLAELARTSLPSSG